MEETLAFLKTQSDEIWKPYLSETPPEELPMNVRWLKGLRVDDVIETDRDETLIVVDDMWKPFMMKPKMSRVIVKRPHLKVPVYLKQCKEFQDCVEIRWSLNEGYKQIEFNKWKVKREGIKINPEVLCTLPVETQSGP
jgi:hypothetical protein